MKAKPNLPTTRPPRRPDTAEARAIVHRLAELSAQASLLADEYTALLSRLAELQTPHGAQQVPGASAPSSRPQRRGTENCTLEPASGMLRQPYDAAEEETTGRYSMVSQEELFYMEEA